MPLHGENSVSSRLSILTFNWHEPYICLLAKTNHHFDVAEPLVRTLPRRWNEAVRPKPQNVRIVSVDEAQSALANKKYDLVLCHNPQDIKAVARFGVPVILLFHNKLATELAIGGNSVKRNKYLADIKPLLERADVLVFVSESKRADWGFDDGVVIKHGVDPNDFYSYSGSECKILRVGNLIRERNMMLGADIQTEIARGFEISVIGNNQSIKNSKPAQSFENLKSLYGSHRVYLNVTLAPYEDGYNLSMLEAMATGAPVVSYGHPNTPIEDGVSGFCSFDVELLRDKINELLQNETLALKTGERGKEMVLVEFSLSKFLEKWNGVFKKVAGRSINNKMEPA
ncbi:hypothetical protein MNBD_NITROSPINAE01-1485 [hydrothermal vent metagenome]|uniref:Glycosyltransferase subfamily 4-like N-terminal domain-containing protein n=1 Tax=hydrothermal vent metagenome TaxID=652676 RepID=A0A3B1BSF2_9ZZZZ